MSEIMKKIIASESYDGAEKGLLKYISKKKLEILNEGKNPRNVYLGRKSFIQMHTEFNELLDFEPKTKPEDQKHYQGAKVEGLTIFLVNVENHCVVV